MIVGFKDMSYEGNTGMLLLRLHVCRLLDTSPTSNRVTSIVLEAQRGRQKIGELWFTSVG
jgi:hypothetical protein